MKAYSQDVRQRVVRAVDEGHTRAEIALLFGVSLATIKRSLKQRRESGHLIPKAIPGRPAKKGGAWQVGLGTQRASHPDMTLDDHCRLWEMEQGQRVSTATISRAITRLGWTRKKKTRVASERDETARAAWRKQACQHTNQQWVCVEECGSHLALTPLYARAPRGRRAVGRGPRNDGATITLIASLWLQGMGEALFLEGAADASAFEWYVEQILTPSLHSGQTVVMDNLSIHQGVRVRKAIEAMGCHLLYLPSYSPDLSPSEEAFSKLKTFLRRVGARTREALQEAIAAALQAITAQDARGWFTHCGYLAEEPSCSDSEATMAQSL